MLEAEVPVTFQPLGKTVYVLQGTRLVEAAAGAGIALDLPCGGEGVCGKCRLIVSRGAPQPTAVERDVFTGEELDEGFRLACQSSVSEAATVEVPESSLLASYHKILAEWEDDAQTATDPAVGKKYVELPAPSRGDDRPDTSRLEEAIGAFEIDLDLARKIPGRLRRAGFRGTAVLAEGWLIDFEPGQTESENFAIATDVGTTTLVGALLDLDTGRQRAVTSRLNPQTSFGDDVLSRILHARKGPEELNELHETIIGAVNEMIGELATQAGVARRRIYELTFSGDTTMQQLLCRIDPSSLGEVPFVPTIGRHLLVQASKLGFHVHPRARAFVMPVIGGFVGGDTVSGILATGLTNTEGPTLLVDIGTNGEIVLAAGGKLMAASTAAGPAFEGARISHGMRGSTGAIEKVVADGSLRTNVIGNVPPVGLCGSALIDLAAVLLQHEVITPEGRLKTAEELPDDVLPDLRRRIVAHNGKASVLLVPESETGTGKAIVLTQRDIRELQLATGAIRAGIKILLRRGGVEPADLQSVLIGGGFGNFIRRSNAQRIGLLPPEVPRHRLRYQGNTSLAGARLVAISRRARQLADELAARAEHVDLSCDADFQMEFAEAMIFPSC